MRHFNKTAWTLLAGLLLAACAQDESIIDNNGKTVREGVTASIEGFKTDGETRTTLTLDDSYGLRFTWSADDKVGVFGKDGMSQSTMEITAGTGTKEATFSCESFQLAAGKDYCAYLPYDGTAATGSSVTEAKIPVSYTGQTQVGNASTDHLGAYDYLVSDVKTPETVNTAHFTFQHMGAPVRLQITMPEAGDWSSVELAAADGGNAFTTSAYLNLFNDTYGDAALEPNATASSMTLSLSDGTNSYISTTTDAPVLTVWMMLAPTTYFNATDGKAMTVTVSSTSGDTYTASITPGKELKQGYAYSFSISASDLSKEESPFLAGPFKVGENSDGTGIFVTFAKGNLQYNLTTKKYQLAENQWTYLNTATSRTAKYFTVDENNLITTSKNSISDVIDMFGWGTGKNPAYASAVSSDYLGSTCTWSDTRINSESDANALQGSSDDWGTCAANDIPSLSGSLTLNEGEMENLGIYQYWTVVYLSGADISTTDGILGLVVFPYDTTQETASSYLKTGEVYMENWYEKDDYTDVTIGTMTVENLNKSGALFLPAGGYCGEAFGIITSGANKAFHYWTSTFFNYTYAEVTLLSTALTGEPFTLGCLNQQKHVSALVRLAKYVTVTE